MTEENDISDLIGAYVTCDACGSNDIERNASAEWGVAKGAWTLKSVFEVYNCSECEKDCTPIWKLDHVYRTQKIAQLNDTVRRGHDKNSTIIATRGVQSLGDAFIAKAIRQVSPFSDFSEDNDPYGEHDFGAFEIDGQKVFWKIDPYDLEKKQGSPDRASAAVTHRVLTIMLADEY